MEKESKAERPPKSEGSEERINQTALVEDSIQHDDDSCEADRATTEKLSFEGFEPANTTPVPDILFDRLLSKLNGAELKALLYIIRRTWGFKKSEDAISLSQFQHGIITRDGKVLDEGCGVKDRTTLVKALTSLVKKGFIKCIKLYNDETKEYEVSHYSIRFKSDNEGSRENPLGVVGKPDGGSGQNPPTPSGQNRTRGSGQTRRTRNSTTRNSVQETVVQGTYGANAPTSPALPQRKKPARVPKEVKAKPDLFADASPEIQSVVSEWRAIFKTPVAVTAKLIEHATTLAAFQPVPGEIVKCRLWMYQTDTKKWYTTHGMQLGDVAREFERFRSLASVPVSRPDDQFVNGKKRIHLSSFDDPNYDISKDFYPNKREVSHAATF